MAYSSHLDQLNVFMLWLTIFIDSQPDKAQPDVDVFVHDCMIIQTKGGGVAI